MVWIWAMVVLESSRFSDGVQHVNARVTVRQAVVVVGCDVQRVRVSNLSKFGLRMMLKVNNQMAFDDQVFAHCFKVTSSL